LSLPLVISSSRELNQLQTLWKSQLDPVLSKPLLSGNFLSEVVLQIGNNTIYHKLNRMLQGWMITDSNASSEIYRSLAKNDSTLTLNSSAIVTVDLYVF
jgi:hypothetical protein